MRDLRCGEKANSEDTCKRDKILVVIVLILVWLLVLTLNKAINFRKLVLSEFSFSTLFLWSALKQPLIQFLGARIVFPLVFGKHPGHYRHSHNINNGFPGCWNAHSVRQLHGCTFSHLLFSSKDCPTSPAVLLPAAGKSLHNQTDRFRTGEIPPLPFLGKLGNASCNELTGRVKSPPAVGLLSAFLSQNCCTHKCNKCSCRALPRWPSGPTLSAVTECKKLSSQQFSVCRQGERVRKTHISSCFNAWDLKVQGLALDY